MAGTDMISDPTIREYSEACDESNAAAVRLMAFHGRRTRRQAEPDDDEAKLAALESDYKAKHARVEALADAITAAEIGRAPT
jgi:hypothetical protein